MAVGMLCFACVLRRGCYFSRRGASDRARTADPGAEAAAAAVAAAVVAVAVVPVAALAALESSKWSAHVPSQPPGASTADSGLGPWSCRGWPSWLHRAAATTGLSVTSERHVTGDRASRVVRSCRHGTRGSSSPKQCGPADTGLGGHRHEQCGPADTGLGARRHEPCGPCRHETRRSASRAVRSCRHGTRGSASRAARSCRHGTRGSASRAVRSCRHETRDEMGAVGVGEIVYVVQYTEGPFRAVALGPTLRHKAALHATYN